MAIKAAQEVKIVAFKIGMGRGTSLDDLILSREDAEGVLGELLSSGWQLLSTSSARDEEDEDCVVLILQRPRPAA